LKNLIKKKKHDTGRMKLRDLFFIVLITTMLFALFLASTLEGKRNAGAVLGAGVQGRI
jgi:hypothetical protein